jgi:hypothetical protein
VSQSDHNPAAARPASSIGQLRFTVDEVAEMLGPRFADLVLVDPG